jgi:FKBP-type peptidyl-prolyl cis-trans isomerase FkpA
MKSGRGGVEYEDLKLGKGCVAGRGSAVSVRYDLFLNRGDKVQENQMCSFRIGERAVVPGLEYGVEGMQAGGKRRLRMGPHLAYREQGIPGIIPANAVLEFHVTMLGVSQGIGADWPVPQQDCLADRNAGRLPGFSIALRRGIATIFGLGCCGVKSQNATGNGGVMEYRTERRRLWTRLVRWAARVWSIASIGLLLGFVVGEGINPTTRTESLGLLFFPLGISVGMILGWWREGIGGIITVGSLLVFYGIHISSTGTLPRGWAWLAFAVPGFLFLLSWYRARTESKTDGGDHD